MTGFGLMQGTLRRSGKLLPFARVLLIGELALQAGRHFGKLEPAERTRLLVLLGRTRGRPTSLALHERAELLALVAKMEPQVFTATAVGRLSPVPVPRRMVEGGANLVGRAMRRRS